MVEAGALERMWGEHFATFVGCCVLGFAVNVSGFCVIQTTGAVTLKVSRHHLGCFMNTRLSFCGCAYVQILALLRRAHLSTSHFLTVLSISKQNIHFFCPRQVLGTARNAGLILFCWMFLGEVITATEGLGYLTALSAFSYYSYLQVNAAHRLVKSILAALRLNHLNGPFECLHLLVVESLMLQFEL